MGNPVICIDIAGGAGIFKAQGIGSATFTWNFPSNWSGYTTGPGNNTLVITGVSLPVFSSSISVTSSLGGTALMQIILEECREKGLTDCEKGERSVRPKNAGEILQDAVILYPNPARDAILVTAKGGNIQKISIYSSVGNLINELPYTGQNPLIDISALPNGAYFMSIQLDEDTVLKRFIKAD